jgi:hypothetical protein
MIAAITPAFLGQDGCTQAKLPGGEASVFKDIRSLLQTFFRAVSGILPSSSSDYGRRIAVGLASFLGRASFNCRGEAALASLESSSLSSKTAPLCLSIGIILRAFVNSLCNSRH